MCPCDWSLTAAKSTGESQHTAALRHCWISRPFRGTLRQLFDQRHHSGFVLPLSVAAPGYFAVCTDDCVHCCFTLLQVWFSEGSQSGRWWTGQVLDVRHHNAEDPWEQLYIEYGKVRDGIQVTTHKSKPRLLVTSSNHAQSACHLLK